MGRARHMSEPKEQSVSRRLRERAEQLENLALDAESLYAEIHSCVSTKTPRRAILAGDADPGHGRFAVARATRHET